MTNKKTGLLFPEGERPSPHPTPKKSQKQNAMANALKSIEEAKDRQSRSKIIAKMAKAKDPWVCEVLIRALCDPIEDIRKTIIIELASREDLDLSLLYQRLHKTPWYVKTGCLRILGLRKNISSVKYMESLVDDPNIEVRRTLALVLGEIGGKKALGLLTKLSEDASSFVRAPALQALQDISQVKFS
jgi:HEAT repeat protein